MQALYGVAQSNYDARPGGGRADSGARIGREEVAGRDLGPGQSRVMNREMGQIPVETSPILFVEKVGFL